MNPGIGSSIFLYNNIIDLTSLRTAKESEPLLRCRACSAQKILFAKIALEF